MLSVKFFSLLINVLFMFFLFSHYFPKPRYFVANKYIEYNSPCGESYISVVFSEKQEEGLGGCTLVDNIITCTSADTIAWYGVPDLSEENIDHEKRSFNTTKECENKRERNNPKVFP